MKKLIGILIIVGLLFGGYIVWQKNKGQLGTVEYQRPQEIKEIKLDILEPKDGAVVTEPTIILRGITSPSAEVFVNDIELQADAQGNFETPLTLEEGENIIAVLANDENGKFAEKEIIVTLELPEEEGETF